MTLFRVLIQTASGAAVTGSVYAESYLEAREIARARFNGRVVRIEMIG